MSQSPGLSPSLDSLLDLACRDGVDIRPTLLRVLTDLYVQKPAHSAEEESQYVELALGLIGAADAATRAAVTATLRLYPATPLAILARLDGAAPAQAPAAAIVAAAPIAPTRESLTELFFAAAPEERRLILLNLDIAGSAPPPPKTDAIRQLEAAALQRRPAEFCRVLAGALHIERALAERIVGDSSGEPLVVTARALGMKAAVLQRVLLFLDPAIGQSVARVYDLAQFFDELPPQAAHRMLAIWRQDAAPAKPAHEPMHWNDVHRSARAETAAATSGRHPGNAGRRDPQPRRSTRPDRTGSRA